MAPPPGSAPSDDASGAGATALHRLRHDLSNPLAAVLAEAQLLLLSEDTLGGEVVAGLKQIEALARQMRQILEDARG
jgi:signal transduction histidine kinase